MLGTPKSSRVKELGFGEYLSVVKNPLKLYSTEPLQQAEQHSRGGVRGLAMS